MFKTEAIAELFLALGRALHEAGAPAHRVERVVSESAAALGMRVEVFAEPTLLAVTLDGETRMARVQPRELHLEYLEGVERVAQWVAEGLDARAALRELAHLKHRPPRYRRRAVVLSWAVTSAAAAIFMGGGPVDLLVAGALGLLVGILPAGHGLLLVAAALTSGLAALAAHVLPVAPYVVTISALIILLPGLSLTVALSELATGHVSSGTARLTSVGVAFLQLAVGVALGQRLVSFVPGTPLAPLPALPTELIPLDIVLMAPALVVLFRARSALLLPVAAAGLLAWGGAQLGAALLGPELGAGLGALGVGLAGNAYARWSGGPAAALTMPGLLVLVPGTVGFAAMNAMLGHQVVPGVEGVFRMLMVAGSLVAGLLLASALLPPVRPRRLGELAGKPAQAS